MIDAYYASDEKHRCDYYWLTLVKMVSTGNSVLLLVSILARMTASDYYWQLVSDKSDYTIYIRYSVDSQPWN